MFPRIVTDDMPEQIRFFCKTAYDLKVSVDNAGGYMIFISKKNTELCKLNPNTLLLSNNLGTEISRK